MRTGQGEALADLGLSEGSRSAAGGSGDPSTGLSCSMMVSHASVEGVGLGLALCTAPGGAVRAPRAPGLGCGCTVSMLSWLRAPKGPLSEEGLGGAGSVLSTRPSLS